MLYFHYGFCGLNAEACSEPWQTFTMELFYKNSVEIKNQIKAIILK